VLSTKLKKVHDGVGVVEGLQIPIVYVGGWDYVDEEMKKDNK
jgi:hypothetical protein